MITEQEINKICQANDIEFTIEHLVLKSYPPIYECTTKFKFKNGDVMGCSYKRITHEMAYNEALSTAEEQLKEANVI